MRHLSHAFRDLVGSFERHLWLWMVVCERLCCLVSAPRMVFNLSSVLGLVGPLCWYMNTP